MIEIERKFLVLNNNYKSLASTYFIIEQGFLNTHPERTVRVRLKGEIGVVTVKGKSNATGTTRFEWETEIAKHEALALLELCEPGKIKKIRYEVFFKNHLFEVDEFLDDNSGLVLAEVELKNEHELIEKPIWLGEEVTGNTAYYNSQLSKKPYNTW